MKRISILFFTILLMPGFLRAQDLYSIALKNIDGAPMDLSVYKGGKILFLIVPLTAADSNWVQLTAFQAKYGGQLQLIGIPALDEGFENGDAARLKKLYQDNGINILLTEGMLTKKTAGAAQAPLMQWLTHKNQNQHFDMDAKGVGHMFLVDEEGKLYAVLDPKFSLSLPHMEKIINRALIKKN
jgi:glutathione peroxidase